MPFIEGVDRNQINLFPNTLDDYVSKDNPVRVIDAYVDSLDLGDLGFRVYSGKNAGQRPYRRKDLLKLYLYCYMNRIRSSRRMEIETTRNIEVMWLIGKITPDHGTISAFMKNNRKAIKQLFKEFILMLKGLGLIDGQIVAIDGTKIKANCAKGKHYNENIIKKKVEYYESKIEKYISDFLEEKKEVNFKETMAYKIESYKDKIKHLENLRKELKEKGKKQICLTDVDAKSMKNNGKFEVCFNMQTVVDSKHKLLVDFAVVNDVNDQGQLSNMVKKSKEVFGENQKITAVLDTGYFNMSQIIESVNDNTEILIKRQKGKHRKVEKGYDKANFKYDKENDSYICPMGYVLKFKWNSKQNGNDYRRYICYDYMNCGRKDVCTSAKEGRAITRLKDEDIIDMVDKNTILKNKIYKKRGSIVEHPFGTIKRHFGYTYFLTRGLDSVNTEGSLICLAYNFKRLINIMGVHELIRYFKEVILSKSYMFCHL